MSSLQAISMVVVRERKKWWTCGHFLYTCIHTNTHTHTHTHTHIHTHTHAIHIWPRGRLCHFPLSCTLKGNVLPFLHGTEALGSLPWHCHVYRYTFIQDFSHPCSLPSIHYNILFHLWVRSRESLFYSDFRIKSP